MIAPRATILMYHRLGAKAVGRPEDEVYRLTPDEFETQMGLLARRRLPVVAASALESPSLPRRGVVLTFDDGCDSDCTVALPILRRHGFLATFFVSPGLVGRPSYLSWEGVTRLAAEGMEIGTHGIDHTLLGEVSVAEAERQLRESRAELERRLRRRVDSASLPGGSGGRRIARLALRVGYRRVMGSHPGLAGAGAGPLLPRFAIRRNTDETDFTALIGQEPSIRLRCWARHSALRSARRLLGPARYEAVKARLLGDRGRPVGNGVAGV
jgi:peptidoglycan/xylan/chitin deacetylase (PgdA/CDA1 family)